MSDSQKPRVIIELDELIEQATKERSHYYVKSVAEKAQLAIGMLVSENERLEKKLGIAKQAAEFLWDQLVVSGNRDFWIERSAYDQLMQQALLIREALSKTRGAMTYAYEDRCDQYYLNVKDDIDKALEQFDEFMRGVK